METSRFQSVQEGEFTLRPYEAQINLVALKIEKIEQDLVQLDGKYRQTQSGEVYITDKQRELVRLKEEHDRMMKNIREKSR